MAENEVRILTDEKLPLLALRGMIVFPYTVTPLDVGRPKSVRALEEAMLHDRLIVLVAQKDARVAEPEPDELYDVGVVAEIKQLLRMPDGQLKVLVEGLRRVRIKEFVQDDPFFEVIVEDMEELQENEAITAEDEALMRSVVAEFENYVKLSKRLPAEVMVSISVLQEPARLSDSIAAHLVVALDVRQRLLEIADPRERLQEILVILSRELEILELERKIHLRVRKQMEKSQKEYYLREQIKAIQKELGEEDERQNEIDEYEEKIEKAKMPKEAKEKALSELRRLEKMPPMAAEAVVVRNYLDWLVSMPWSVRTKDRIDIEKARQILEADHYGLEEVKERILEFLAVKHLTKKMKGPILCLVGPPGVGKTSLAQSIAKSMNRRFVRFSLGGVRDEAEIRGHRRTYVGALPGRIIQSIRKAGSSNPVILLDEVDKMSRDFRGDPAAALLEVLDPEQNSNFTDHYLEVPFDLSDVMFITTANYLENIPRPLLDRMEVIRIPGYTEEEKLEIAKRHLLPKQLTANGLREEQIQVSENALKRLISEYTRESGVRNLEREIGRVCRKVARLIVEGEPAPVRVTQRKLESLLGKPRFRRSMAELQDKVGVVTGLAYTEYGGDILFIEVTVLPGKGKLILTGHLGDVMKESAQAAFSYVRASAKQLGVPVNFHENHDVHIHVPEGAVPKDGPSAGIALTTALVSALTGRPVRGDLAMTGEVTLRGRVLPIGGVKEKILAAHRAGIKVVLLPEDNRKDLDDIPANVLRKITVHLVDHMDQVLAYALRPASRPVSVPGEELEAEAESADESLGFIPGEFEKDRWGERPHESQ